jgi:hypothetical protein
MQDFGSPTGGGTSETAENIKTKYESNKNTNAFTDAYKQKLDAINGTGGGGEMTLDDGRVIKRRLVTQMLDGAESTSINHGLDYSKILSVEVCVEVGGYFSVRYPPTDGAVGARSYTATVRKNDVFIMVSAETSEDIKTGKAIILITYLA